MSRRTVAALGVLAIVAAVAARAGVARPEAASIPAGAKAIAAPAHANAARAAAALIDSYCTGCHNDVDKTGGLTLEHFDVAHADQNAELSEKIIGKLRAGFMPPTGERRPDAASVTALVTTLETEVDAAAAKHPNPGSRPFQRLNRAEYTRAIHDLLDLDVDVDAFLPPDTISHGFDNVADVQGFSPAMMEGYMRAAAAISREALGDVTATPTQTTYKVPHTEGQMSHVDGTPFGTRGGISVIQNFPADGNYIFKMLLHSTGVGGLFGATARGEQIDVSVDGSRVGLLDIDPRMSESGPNGMNLATPQIEVSAGPHRVSAAFVERITGPVNDLIQPLELTLADTNIGSAQGITTLPHLRDFAIVGPYQVTGVSETPSRHRILACTPKTAAEERACATKIVTSLATEAYRRPVTNADVAPLLNFYDSGRKDGSGFEVGIRTALQAVLASPEFVFRLEDAPANAKPGQNYRLSDLELASRLSFFLWATVPDAELVATASQGKLKDPAVFDREVRRMLADPKAETLSTRFASQWFRLQDLEPMHPDALLYPHFDTTLARDMARETQLLFNSLVQEDRNVLDLLTANYTFVNEPLAAHYGIPNVAGTAFRRVTLTDDSRRGILGQGSILVLTSVADRTSPVQRGKWVLEVLLGTSPPPPPPNVPAFEDTKGVEGNRVLSTRERMEEHRKNPACQSCHRVIDPIGLALDNFDVTGVWRIKDHGVPVDATSQLYDGTPLNGPASLRQALLKHSDVILRNFTERLMTYALGRRVEYYDMPTVRAIVNDAAQHDNRMSSFILGVVKSPAFQMGRVEVDTPPASKR